MDLLSTLIALLSLAVLVAALLNPLRPLDDATNDDPQRGPAASLKDRS